MRSAPGALDPDIAAVAALLADPSRARMLEALSDGSARPAGELARAAQVTPQTASAHLAQLLHGRLLAVEVQGRHRYYRLRNARVAALLETLAQMAPPARPLTAAQQERARGVRFARTCYGHLAGTVGVAVVEALCARQLLRAGDTDYELTQTGGAWFRSLGIELETLRRRPLTRRCLDWSERRPHLAGALGVALAARVLTLRWLVPVRGSRALRLTDQGRESLRSTLSLEL